jgi:hypothetical protein
VQGFSPTIADDARNSEKVGTSVENAFEILAGFGRHSQA